MTEACRDFRARLAAALEPSAGSAASERTALAWHAHLLECEPCRAVLEAEDALELLLESLPRPALPPDLAARVLSRLRSARVAGASEEAALDRLLELGPIETPEGLAQQVLAGLRPHRETEARGTWVRGDRLDRLLDRVPPPSPPEGLAGRVLARLASERPREAATAAETAPRVRSGGDPVGSEPAAPARAAPARKVRRHPLQPVSPARERSAGSESRARAYPARPAARVPSAPTPRGPGRPWLAALAAAALALFGWVAWTRFGAGFGRSTGEAPTASGGGAAEVPAELLASLELLEAWDLVAEDDPELALAELDELDLLLLELEGS